MKKNRSLHFIIFSLCSLLLIFSGLFFAFRLFKDDIIARQRNELETQSVLIKSAIDTQERIHFNEQNIQSLAKKIDKRITIMDQQAMILYDNDKGTKLATTDEIRRSRPEVKQVINGKSSGFALRESPTFHQTLLYVAIPLKNQQNQLIGILRVSEAYAGFSAGIRQFSIVVTVLALIFTGALLLLLYLFLQERKAPVKDLIPFVDQLLEGKAPTASLPRESAEWDILNGKLEELAAQTNEEHRSKVTAEKQLAFFLEELMVGIFMIHTNQELVYLNEKMGTLFDIKEWQKHKTYLEVIKNPELLRLIQQSIDTRKDGQKELHLTFPKELYIDVSIHVLEGEADTPATLLGVIYDLTEVRQLENMQQDFVGNVSHELKTPITSLIGFTETLLDGAMNDKEALVSFLQIIHKDAQRLLALVQDIIALSRNKNHYAETERQKISPYQEVLSITKQLQFLITEKQTKINIKGNPNLIISMNAALLHPILKNLIENAIRYTPEQGKVVITVNEEHEELVVRIADNGIGLSEDDQKLVFRRFYRADKARARNTGGTGLGLAIVQHHLKLLDGTIDVESHLGMGSAFTIKIPFER